MDKQPVGQLPDLQQSNNDDEIMVITNDEYNQLKKEKISDFITDLQSTNTNNSLTTGSDGKLFVSKTINATDIDGVLALDNIPQLTTNKLPETGISADNYSYPSSITVNDRGQVVSIVEGSAAEAGAYLDQSQITNCILEAPNGVATYSGSTFTVKQGLKVLIPNGRNEDKTLKNIEYTVPKDITINYAGVGNSTYNFTLLYGNTGDWAISQNYQEADTPPAFGGISQYYLNTKENIMYFNYNSERWEAKTVAVLGKGKLENGVIVSFTPYQPVTIAKDTDVVHITGEEKIGGQKQFLRPFKIDCRESELGSNTAMYLTGRNRTAGQTNYSGPSILSYAPNYDMTDETAANQANAFGMQLLPLDKNGQYWGNFQFYNSYFNNSGTSVSSSWGVRRYVDGALKSGTVSLGISEQSTWFSFPKCTSRPTTTSSAGTSNVDVIVNNYYSDTKGYVQFGSGLKIQWGRAKLSTQNSTTVTFPIAFQSTNYNVSAIVERYTSTSVAYTDDTVVTINGMANSNLVLYLYDSAKNKYDAYVRWHAIGY